jgi:biopolymer transport protein ExbD
MQRRKMKKPPKLNLIPILDAIFIFIFFLLMSAQFLDIFEIGSDAPISASSEKHPDKDPLNLTLELKGETITVKTGLNGNIKKKISFKNLKELNELLIEIKKEYPKESSAILKPSKNFKYHKIVNIIDSTREIQKPGVFVSVIENNRKVASTKLFDQIIFETQD